MPGLTPPGDPKKLLALGETICLSRGYDTVRDQDGVKRVKIVDIAEVLGLPTGTISAWRNGKVQGVGLNVIDRIATDHERHYSEFLRDGVDLDNTERAKREARKLQEV